MRNHRYNSVGSNLSYAHQGNLPRSDLHLLKLGLLICRYILFVSYTGELL